MCRYHSYIHTTYDVPKLSAVCVLCADRKNNDHPNLLRHHAKTKRTAVRQVSDTNTAVPGMCIPRTTRDQVPGIRCNQVSGQIT